ncbi:MAG: chaperonin cofactor prefoldin [Arenicella sp.]|jgi:chaperonin cofactor prefoldin
MARFCKSYFWIGAVCCLVLTSCRSREERLEDAHDNLQEASDDLEDALQNLNDVFEKSNERLDSVFQDVNQRYDDSLNTNN